MNSRSKWDHKSMDEYDNGVKKELLESILLYLEEQCNFLFSDNEVEDVE